MVMFQPHAVPVSRDSLQNAMDWLRNLDSVAATTKTSACEGVRKAFEDKNVSIVSFYKGFPKRHSPHAQASVSGRYARTVCGYAQISAKNKK